MASRRVFLVRLRRYARLWYALFLQDALAPLRDKTAFLQFIAIPIFLVLLFIYRGLGAMVGELRDITIVVEAIIYAIPLYLLWCASAALINVRSEELKKGQWFGGHFVYHSPLLVKTVRVTSENNEEVFPVKMNEVEPGGYVFIETSIEGFEKRRAKCQVFMGQHRNTPVGPLPWNIVSYGSTHYSMYIEKDKTLFLATNCETTNWSIVRAYLTSFSVN